MITETLSLIDPKLEVSELLENQQYGFKIKWVHLPALKCQLLFTEGLSNNVQKVKAGFEDFNKIELYFCLPEFWNLRVDKWPIHWIERLACIPQKNNTWYGPGDTIPAGNPPENLSERLKANHFMLVEPITLGPLFDDPNRSDLNIKFLGLVPITQEELDYKIRNSATVLTLKMIDANFTEKVDMFRKTVCRKRFFGLF